MYEFLIKLESGLRRRLRERYDSIRTWNRIKVESVWDLLLFVRTIQERRIKRELQETGGASLVIDEKRGFGFLDSLERDYIEKVQQLAIARRNLIKDQLIKKNNSKEYLQQIFDMSLVNRENIFFLEGILKSHLVQEVSGYFGSKVPILHEASIFYSPPSDKFGSDFEGSQLYHRDGEGTKNLKIWILCDETTEESGPTVLLDAASSSAIAREINYIPGMKIDDQTIESTSSYKNAEKFLAIGTKGTVFYTDTCRSFHYGSRTSTSSSRLVAMFHFVENNSSYYFPYISRTFTSRLKPLSPDVQAWAKESFTTRALLSKRLLYSN
jgi:hypothetical protein